MTGAKETAKLTGKETAAHKPTEAKPKADAKDDTRSKSKAKSKAKLKPNIPSVIVSPLEHIDKPVDISKDIDIGIPDREVLAENLEATRTNDQASGVTEAILEAAAETERLTEDAEGLQAEDEQADILVETEDSDVVESLSQDAVDTQTDKLTDDVAESFFEAYDTTESTTEKEDDFQADKKAGDPTEVDVGSSDTKIHTEGLEATQTDDQAGGVTEAILEAAAETERFAEEADGLQAEDEQADILVEAEDSDVAESLSRDAIDIQTDKLTDDVSESVDAEAPKEKLDNTKADNQAVEAVSEKTVTEDSAESIDDALTDKQVGDADEGVDQDLHTIESSAEKADGTQIDNQVVSASEANTEGTDDEIQSAVYNDNKRSRIKKTGIIISLFIVTAAVVLLIVAFIERRSAKSALVQVIKVAESIKQMQGEALKNREQVTHSQIESSELVIDSLLLTRNGLELERANSDEVEVKRIIDVFISDIDERITKIKGNIVLLRNKLKEAN
ncbi:MAG: hypothetical protein SCABRO_00198 [Candidatus Scalindua brodae]|uniref:Uncharacterized protein n=1 Tax=Candidatus Scalindua brodae TaxID=237368 RepID=A0A0B0ETR2_9BACT|nr:MAG: hypothetical protein SCABRO_00198 [Candidatus Scalindua brodae]